MSANLEEDPIQINPVAQTNRNWNTYLTNFLLKNNLNTASKLPSERVIDLLDQWIRTELQITVKFSNSFNHKTQHIPTSDLLQDSSLQQTQNPNYHLLAKQQTPARFRQIMKNLVSVNYGQEQIDIVKLRDYDLVRKVVQENIRISIQQGKQEEGNIKDIEKVQKSFANQENQGHLGNRLDLQNTNSEKIQPKDIQVQTYTVKRQVKQEQPLQMLQKIQIPQVTTPKQKEHRMAEMDLNRVQQSSDQPIEIPNQKQNISEKGTHKNHFRLQSRSFPVRNYQKVRRSLGSNSNLQNNLDSSHLSQSLSKPSIISLHQHPYLYKLFKHLCQQSIAKGRSPTFDQIAQSGNLMNLNKWMVFCKQFGFLEKFVKKEMVKVFREASYERSQMGYQGFMEAVDMVREMLKVQTEVLIKQILHVKDQVDYRRRIANMKIQYFGPTRDSFAEVQIKQITRKINRMLIKPQANPINPPFSSQKQTQQNQSKLLSPQTHKSPPLNRKHYFKSTYRNFIQQHSTYSQLFKSKIQTQKTNSTYTSNGGYKLNRILRQAKGQASTHSQNSSVIVNGSNSKVSVGVSASLGNASPERQWLTGSDLGIQHNRKDTLPSINMQSIDEERIDTYMVDSDAESDEILKQHYKIQKKGLQLMAYSRIVQQLKLKTEEQEEQNLFQGTDDISESEDNETHYLITQHH